ncbi:unnamed protein product [Spirodela intermedia]|uniref:Uncharacterized protein n=2 Tax=Spirodela intermedia TaxID=51605 RepID=A0A7I8JIT8_SPIIN|nr:unnamed protein product [Spirodela intermedia]CAA6670074.1 unnamed protein product [Spirodela intermedia]CAA7407118.1 unnamed protein product [Spirodela intermedia]
MTARMASETLKLSPYQELPDDTHYSFPINILQIDRSSQFVFLNT